MRILVLLIKNTPPELTFLYISIKIPPIVIQTFGTLFLLYEIIQILDIYKYIQIINKNNETQHSI